MINLSLETAKHLDAHEQGWWPVIGAIVDDIRSGDLLQNKETGKEIHVALAWQGDDTPLWREIIPIVGEPIGLGRLNRSYWVYRRGNHATLSKFCR